jgi:hypothetical protein
MGMIYGSPTGRQKVICLQNKFVAESKDVSKNIE